MKSTYRSVCCRWFALGAMLAACSQKPQADQTAATNTPAALPDTARHPKTATSPTLPRPYATRSARVFSRVMGWPAGKTPTAPPGFRVTLFAEGLAHPRWLYVLPNGDVLVAQAATTPNSAAKKVVAALGLDPSKTLHSVSPNSIALLRDRDHDGRADERRTFLAPARGPDKPFGMALLGTTLYVAGTAEIRTYAYRAGQDSIGTAGRKILDLPAGGYNNHWTRNLLAAPDGRKLYVTVGSASNVQEHGADVEQRRACILEINPDGSGERLYASGLRNPVGAGWAPGTGVLWTAVNERDGLGDDLVPDYLTSVQPGGFYGWPYSYFGQHEDPRLAGQRPDLVRTALVPDVPLGAHTASLGLAFCTRNAFPARYRGGAFIGQHGSWNRSALAGYQVAFVPFSEGRPTGPPEPFLTGFIADAARQEVYGRPVGVTELPDGSLLVADDASDCIWHVRATR